MAFDSKKLEELAKLVGETESPLKKLGERLSQAMQAVDPMSGVHKYLDWEKAASADFKQLFERLDRENPHIDPAIFEKLTRLLAREPIQGATRPDEAVAKDFFTFAQLAKRWGVSWGTVQNWLRAGHVPVLDRAPRGKRGKKVVALKDVLEFEKRNTKRIR